MTFGNNESRPSGPGQPPKCWKDYVTDALVNLHMQFDWSKISQDHVRWKLLLTLHTLLIHTR